MARKVTNPALIAISDIEQILDELENPADRARVVAWVCERHGKPVTAPLPHCNMPPLSDVRPAAKREEQHE